ncbi:hypothetical protein [Bradyrhizobium sp. I1.7.5]|uniref:hypothetical protein n=2 Tax=Nitrobacteraceae TaxID=41294 RepID=UPI00339B84CB
MNGKNPEFILFRDPEIPDFTSNEGKGCAAFDMEGDKIVKMALRRCFFGAEDVPPEQFAKSVMRAYGINASCKMRLMPDRSVEPYCSGTTDKGEVVEINSAEISVERMRQKPRFN